MTATPRTVLVVDRPGAFRDALARAIAERGGSVLTSDDSLDALARLSPAPDVLLIGEDAGPPGGAVTCRIARRKLGSSGVFLLCSEGPAAPREGDVLLRGWGADALAALLLRPAGAQPASADELAKNVRRGFEISVPALRLGELLLSLAERSVTGRLLLNSADTEREVYLMHGLPVFARSSLLGERLGSIALATRACTSDQIDRALEHARLHGARLAESLIEQGALTGSTAFALLADQLVAQLAAACDAPRTEARLFEGDEWVAHTPILRLHPLTSLLAAVEKGGAEAIDAVIDELADRALAEAPPPAVARSWLRELGATSAELFVTTAPTVRRLRDRLVGATPGDPRRTSPRRAGSDAEGSAARAWANTLTVTLLRSGAVRLAEADGSRARDAMSVTSAAISSAGAPLGAPPAAPLKEPASASERQVQAYLQAPRSVATAALAAARGPAAEAADALAPLLGLYVRRKSAVRPRAVLGVSDAATHAEIRRAYFRLVDEVDAAPLADAAGGPLASCKASELRVKLDEALAEIAPLGAAVVEAEPAAVDAALARPIVEVVSAPAISSTPGEPTKADPRTEPLEKEPAPKITVTKPSPIDWDEPEDEADSSAPKSVPPTARAAPSEDESTAVAVAAGEAPDPRLLEIEPLLARGKWDEICDLLGPPETASALAPALGLIYAIARKENARRGTVPQELTNDADDLAMRSVSAMLGVREGSSTAVLVAKRTLFVPPVAWTRREVKTNKRLMVMIVIGAIALGIGAQLLISHFL